MASNRAAVARERRSLFATLKAECADEWESYVGHRFVRGLADGSLPERGFRYYLAQDYLFLIQFARAYGLAAYKSERLSELRYASRALSAIVDAELDLHIASCARWGITASALGRTPADPATLAYTRYVLDRGMAGDLLDLHIALAPCVLGYGEIGARLAAERAAAPAPSAVETAYAPWIDTYAGAAYQAVARAAEEELDRLSARHDTPERRPSLIATFREATRLETAFWQMGLDAAASP